MQHPLPTKWASSWGGLGDTPLAPRAFGIFDSIETRSADNESLLGLNAVNVGGRRNGPFETKIGDVT